MVADKRSSEVDTSDKTIIDNNIIDKIVNLEVERYGLVKKDTD